jgi:hypothetical protein
MPLTMVTFTGPDDRTDPAALAALSARHPFVEWAILSSPARTGGPRCPGDAWLGRFLADCKGCNASLHLADGDVDAWIAGDARIRHRIAPFQRIQINFDQRRTPRPVEGVADAIARGGPEVILQYHAGNADMVADLAARGLAFSVLFDASSGKGVRPETWPAPLAGIACGYAGGLGPATVGAELPRIDAVAGDRRYWIDMASSVRTAVDDAFDLGACEAVLRIAAPSIGRTA